MAHISYILAWVSIKLAITSLMYFESRTRHREDVVDFFMFVCSYFSQARNLNMDRHLGSAQEMPSPRTKASKAQFQPNDQLKKFCYIVYLFKVVDFIVHLITSF